jgi:hypothetical protein
MEMTSPDGPRKQKSKGGVKGRELLLLPFFEMVLIFSHELLHPAG